MSKTMQDLAREALDVQDACNLSGVVHGFSRAMESLCRLVPDTRERNRHPVCVLWADKIAHLTGTQCVRDQKAVNEAYSWAYDTLEKSKESCNNLQAQV